MNKKPRKTPRTGGTRKPAARQSRAKAVPRSGIESREQGFVHVYTGNGKGKTTAAFGLALRALGAGKKVFIGQFAKAAASSEARFLAAAGGDSITIRQFGGGAFITGTPSPADMESARKGFEEIGNAVNDDTHDVVIIDEGCIALFYNLIEFQRFSDMIRDRPPHKEIVITGRKASWELINLADLVTEMKEVRHYFAKGVKARKGIEE